MKKTRLIMLFLMALAWTSCHKDKEVDAKDPVVSHEEMTVSGTQARFEWRVDFSGQFQTGVELSQNENMTDVRRVEATKEGNKYVAVVDGLSMETKYYYRIVVWNKFNNYEEETKSFTTSRTFKVTLACLPEEGGTVTGGGTFTDGDTCTLIATANEGYHFVNWVENENQISDEMEYSFIVTNNRNIVAYFSAIQSNEYTINVSANPPQGGTITGGGTYIAGDTCTLTATTNEGYHFVNWMENGNEIQGAGSSYSFMVTGDRTLVANFTSQDYIIHVDIDPENGGVVTGAQGYNYGDQCTLTATSSDGFSFVNWTEGDNEVSINPYSFTVTESHYFVAHFQAIVYSISASAYPDYGGTVSGGGDGFYYGDECTLTATAATGFRFVNWTKNDVVVHGESIYSFPVTESAAFVAHFEEIAFDLDVSANPNVIAQGGSSQLNAAASGGNGNFTYNWSPSSSLNNAAIHDPTASPTVTTTYTCTVTSGGQTGSGSCTVTVVCPPSNLTADVQDNNNVHLNWTAANPATSYKVYKDNTLIASNITTTTYTDSNLGAGTYNYKVSAVYQDVESPASNEVQATIYNSLTVTATANPNTIPDGGSSTLTANASGGNGSYTYSWTPTTGLNNANIQSPTATPSSTTTYTVTVGSNGQTATATVTVNVVKAPTGLTATVQNTNNVHLSWTAVDPATSYKVYKDNTLIAQNVTTTSYNDNNLNAGTYNYQVSAVYQGVESPKSNTAQATIYNSLSVTATATPTIIPLGNSSTLNANATGGNGSYTYSWTPTTGLNNANIQSPTATPSSTTTYTVTVGSNGQTATATVTVNVVKAPTGLTATVQNTNNVHLTWNAANPATSYKVYRNNTMIAQNITSTSYNDNGLNSGTYSYQVSTVYQGVESPKSNSASATISPQAPTGAINGLFSVSATQQVWFSQGNLQYRASTNTWRFAENQWNYVGGTDTDGNQFGNVAGSSNNNVSPTYSGWIDLFGWGTSGYHNASDPYNINYQPWSTNGYTVNETYNYFGYGPSTNMPSPHLTGSSANYDWGVYNPISNGGNQTNQWRTLTYAEWVYLFNTRSTASGIRYAKGTVNNVYGIILLPDNWNNSTYSLNATNQSESSFSSNIISSSQWITLENAGAVFLPAALTRGGSAYNNCLLFTDNYYTAYWSSTAQSSHDGKSVNFYVGVLFFPSSERRSGNPVRLICPVQ